MGLELFEVHFMTLLSTDHTFAWKLPNFCKDFLRRTSAGKICISCRRPSEKNYLLFLRRTSAEKCTLISRRTSEWKITSTANILPRIIYHFSEGQKSVYLSTSFQAVICLGAGRRQDKKHCRRPFNLRLRAIFGKLGKNPSRVDLLSFWLLLQINPSHQIPLLKSTIGEFWF